MTVELYCKEYDDVEQVSKTVEYIRCDASYQEKLPDADTPSLLHLHKIRLRRPLLALHSNGSCLLQCTAVQEEFLGHGGFT